MAAPTRADLAAFLGRTVTSEQGDAVLAIVSAMAKAYTRGRGWTDDGPNAEIRAVILTCAARLVSHPRQVGIDEARGPDSARWMPAHVSWSVAELFTLNRYRVRAL